MSNSHTTPSCVTFKAWFNGEPKIFEVKGKVAKTLYHLVLSGQKGVIALELSNTWALRLGHYISVLRHKYGLDIATIREPHDDQGGWHGRYILNTPVEIIEVS